MDHQKQQQRTTGKVQFSEHTSIQIIERREKNWRLAPKMDARKAARKQAYKLIKKGYGELLKGSFEYPIDNCQENINAFVAGVPDCDNARGLERYMSKEHKQERDLAVEEVLEAVLKLQEHLEEHGISESECTERLRAASCLQSQESRMFARRMGIADALAVKEDEEDEPPRSINTTTSRRPSLLHPLNSQSRHSFPSACNAKKALRQPSTREFRQPSTRELDTGIRSMAACMNAKKASRQASVRDLNSSIRNLAATMHNSTNPNNCSKLSETCSTQSVIHPSFVLACSRKQDGAMGMPRRPRREASVRDCSDIIYSALNMVDEVEAEGQRRTVALRQVAQSA